MTTAVTIPAALPADALAGPVNTSQARLVWRRFRRHRLAVAGVAVLVALLVIA